MGNHFYTGTFTTFQPNSKLRIRTTIRYGQLKTENHIDQFDCELSVQQQPILSFVWGVQLF